MVDEIGDFRDQARAILLDRRQHGLDRLLAELLGAMRHALVEEPARIGGMRARLRALLHALFEIAEGEVRHRSCSALAYHLRSPPQIGQRAWCEPGREAASFHIPPEPASMAQCRAPCSISGSILRRPIPISPRKRSAARSFARNSPTDAGSMTP